MSSVCNSTSKLFWQNFTHAQQKNIFAKSYAETFLLLPKIPIDWTNEFTLLIDCGFHNDE